MKSLQSMVLSKKEMKEVKGARWTVGANTEASGDGSNGAATYVDSSYEGQDGSSGSLYGDSWSYFRTIAATGPATLKIAKR